MKLLFLGDEIPCAKAVKDEAAGTVIAFSENGSVIFEASKVTDFSLFALEGGEWSERKPTEKERIAALEVENAQLKASNAALEDAICELDVMLCGGAE